MGSEITFIIPNRGGEHIEFVIKQMQKFYPNSKYIVITQDDDKPFMRGQLWNVATNFVNTEYMCFLDNDMFFNKYIDLINVYNEKHCVMIQPFNEITQVTLNENNYTSTSSMKLLIWTGAIGPDGGCTFISVKNFKKINGMSNLYIGWGFEDNELKYRCNGKIQTDNTINHISHARRDGDPRNRINNNIFNNRTNRDMQLDGYLQTTYNITKETEENNVKYIYVNNISVCDEFTYQEELQKHLNI